MKEGEGRKTEEERENLRGGEAAKMRSETDGGNKK